MVIYNAKCPLALDSDSNDDNLESELENSDADLLPEGDSHRDYHPVINGVLLFYHSS